MSSINSIIKQIEELGEKSKTVAGVTKNLKAIFSETTQEEKEEIMKEITRRRNKYTEKQRANLNNINFFISGIKCKTKDEIKKILDANKIGITERLGKTIDNIQEKGGQKINEIQTNWKLSREKKAQEKKEKMREELEDIVKSLETISDDTLIDTERKSRDRLYIQGKDLLEKNSTTTDQMEKKIDEIENFYQQIHKRVKTESKEKKSSAEKKLDEAIKKLNDLKKQKESLEEKLENDNKIPEDTTTKTEPEEISKEPVIEPIIEENNNKTIEDTIDEDDEKLSEATKEKLRNISFKEFLKEKFVSLEMIKFIEEKRSDIFNEYYEGEGDQIKEPSDLYFKKGYKRFNEKDDENFAIRPTFSKGFKDRFKKKEKTIDTKEKILDEFVCTNGLTWKKGDDVYSGTGIYIGSMKYILVKGKEVKIVYKNLGGEENQNDIYNFSKPINDEVITTPEGWEITLGKAIYNTNNEYLGKAKCFLDDGKNIIIGYEIDSHESNYIPIYGLGKGPENT